MSGEKAEATAYSYYMRRGRKRCGSIEVRPTLFFSIAGIVWTKRVIYDIIFMEGESMLGSKLGSTMDYVEFLAEHLEHSDLRSRVVAILLELGIPTHRDGYNYLIQVILLFYENPLRSVNSDIYKTIGENCSPMVGTKQMDSAIRKVIVEGWRNRDVVIWNDCFMQQHLWKKSCPSNTEFISGVVSFLELLQGYKKEERA